MNDFLNFVNSWKVRAFEIDLQNGFPNVEWILEKAKRKLANAETSEEIQECREENKKNVKSAKEQILTYLELVNLTNNHLAMVQIYFEYKALFEKAEALEKAKKVRQPTKLPESYDFFNKENYSVSQRDEFIRNARKDFFENPRGLGEKIAELENPEGLGESRILKFVPNSKSLTLTNFLKSIVGKSWGKNKNDQVLKSYREKKENLIDNAKQ